MIKYSVLYPVTENGHFDHEYYRDVHLPLIKARMGDALISYSIDRNIVSGESNEPLWLAACHLVCHSREDLQKGMADHVEEIVADVDNFTNITSVNWISDIVMCFSTGVNRLIGRLTPNENRILKPGYSRFFSARSSAK